MAVDSHNVSPRGNQGAPSVPFVAMWDTVVRVWLLRMPIWGIAFFWLLVRHRHTVAASLRRMKAAMSAGGTALALGLAVGVLVAGALVWPIAVPAAWWGRDKSLMAIVDADGVVHLDVGIGDLCARRVPHR